VLAPGYTFAPKLSSRKLPDGRLVSPSLEDMFPFLPEEEMRNNRYLK
jgi:acetolactate synthase-1/2/3 large subunit